MKPKLIELLQELKRLHVLRDEYIDTVPMDLRGVIWDTKYCELLERENDLMLNRVFKDSVEDAYWFLYDFKAGKSKGPHLVENGVEYTFETDDDYYEYLRTQS